MSLVTVHHTTIKMLLWSAWTKKQLVSTLRRRTSRENRTT